MKDTPLGQSQQWRLPIANEIEKKFLLRYKTSWAKLLSDEYVAISYQERIDLQRSGVEATTEGESYGGSPLVPWEKTKNPDDGTDFDRQQAAAKGVTDTRDTGDNVAGDYVINRELSLDDDPPVDYAEARRKYELFDRIYFR